jgi:hypothetical protein
MSDYTFGVTSGNTPSSADSSTQRVSLRTSSNSYGQFWFGKSIGFPGFLYKKNNGVGARRSTKFVPGGGSGCNTYQDVNNTYTPGSGVGGSSIATRRAKRRFATQSQTCNYLCTLK